MKIVAVLSIPRLGFNDFWGATLATLTQHNVPLLRYTGAFWDQCLTRALEDALATDATHILTLDYDTLFSGDDLDALVATAEANPGIDALAAIQVARCRDQLLCSIRNEDGTEVTAVDRSAFEQPVTPVDTAHFGFTLISTAALRNLPRPWLIGQPDQNGSWREGRVDPDIAFWRAWKQHGRSLALANRVAVGHLELMIAWPDTNMRAIYQRPNELKAGGPPPAKWS
jgi:hypothetical protein